MERRILNKEQKEAVRHGQGPLLIIAGAGTGKTTVITERIKYLILQKKVNPQEILALTFTEKSSQEMETRVDVAMPYGLTQMWISTFHSFCDRVLRDEGLHIGIDTGYKLMTNAENFQFIKSNLFEFELNYFRPLGNPTKFIDGMLQHFSRLQDEDISSEEYLRWVKGKSADEKLEQDKWLELVKAYKKYEELKIKASDFDFGDLITKTLLLFRKRPNVLRNYQQKFKYILVDEFQDTNFAQNQLVLLLAGKNGNITVVADDDQSIYRWRGAAISNVLQFRKIFPKARLVTLTKNYRSCQYILDKAYDLIKHNNPDRLEIAENIDKKLISVRKRQNGEVKFFHLPNVVDEVEAVAEEIENLISKKKYEYKDIAILVRANNHAETFLKTFERSGVPCQFLGPGKLFKNPEVLDLISFLKVLYNPDDSLSFNKFLSIDALRIQILELIKLGRVAKLKNSSLFEAAEESNNENIIKIFKYLKQKLNEIKTKTAGELLFDFLQDFEILPSLVNNDTVAAQTKAKNIANFFQKLKIYENEHKSAGVQEIVDWIELTSDFGESPLALDTDWDETDAVNIMSVHAAKGLEFPVVFLVNLVSERFPTRERQDQIPIPDQLIKENLPKGDFHLQEERRLFYVGMTRAADKLYLTASNFYGEAKRAKKLSPFIFEALGEQATTSEKTKTKQFIFSDYSKKRNIQHTKYNIHHVDALSYSQIETFKTCPMHYKLRYIYNIPSKPSGAQSMGISIHATLKSFFEKVKQNQKPTEKLMLDLLEQNWVAKGYEDKKHQKLARKQTQQYLTGYLKQEFNPKLKPLMLEQPFVVSLPQLKLVGVIDRIDKTSKVIEIIDYKTGHPPTGGKKEVDKNLQLTIYALAAKELFGVDLKDIKLSLYYFEEQKKITTTRTKKDLENAQKEILEIKKQIENSNFECSKDFFCQNCEYSMFCHSSA